MLSGIPLALGVRTGIQDRHVYVWPLGPNQASMDRQTGFWKGVSCFGPAVRLEMKTRDLSGMRLKWMRPRFLQSALNWRVLPACSGGNGRLQ